MEDSCLGKSSDQGSSKRSKSVWNAVTALPGTVDAFSSERPSGIYRRGLSEGLGESSIMLTLATANLERRAYSCNPFPVGGLQANAVTYS